MPFHTFSDEQGQFINRQYLDDNFSRVSGYINVKASPYLAVGDGIIDDTAAIQKAITFLSALGGGELYIPPGVYKITSTITIPSPVWTPFLITGASNTVINSTTLNGTVFQDNSGAVVFSSIKFSGPGKLNASAWAISSALGLGQVFNCVFTGYYYGIECSGSTSGLINRNRFSLCHAGVNCVKINPLFSNIVSLYKNYFDFNDYGIFFSEVYGLTLDSNAFEFNSTGALLSGVRELAIRNGNWFESNTSFAFQLTTSCTGVIDYQTHIVGNSYTIDSTCVILDNLTSASCVLKLSAVVSIAHNTVTDVLFDTETFDPSNIHSPGASANIVISRQGIYRVSFTAQMAAVAAPAAGVGFKIVVKNNAVVIRNSLVPMLANLTSDTCISFEDKFFAGDIIQCSVYQNSGAAVNLNAGTFTSFSCSLIYPV